MASPFVAQFSAILGVYFQRVTNQLRTRLVTSTAAAVAFIGIADKKKNQQASLDTCVPTPCEVHRFPKHAPATHAPGKH
ncbi:hypothetical protein PHMEG_00040304 [Phytophthora megakarya]|uniref:Uncharacterized protein n=1 Tax=Phytophthora megakarya TaxID=4795 RepID=A0A225UE69_9STRA|nr:hypothetical protein PHMEG_00040304 [Phytophthora megakarya]